MHHFWVSEAKSLEVSRPGYRLKVMLSVSTQSTGNHLFVLQFNHSCHFYGCRHMLASLLSMPPLLFQLQTHTHVHTHTQLVNTKKPPALYNPPPPRKVAKYTNPPAQRVAEKAPKCVNPRLGLPQVYDTFWGFCGTIFGGFGIIRPVSWSYSGGFKYACGGLSAFCWVFVVQFLGVFSILRE